MKKYQHSINFEKLQLKEYLYLKRLLRNHSEEVCPDSKYTGVVTGVPEESTLGTLLKKFNI